MRGRALLYGGTAVVIGACAGQPTLASPSTRSCSPPLPTAHPRKAAPGDSLHLRDRGLPCRPYAGPQRYRVFLAAPVKPGGLPDYDHLRRVASFRVGRWGAFDVRITLPASVVHGSAQLIVKGRALDRRLACPPAGSCRYFSAGIIITRGH